MIRTCERLINYDAGSQQQRDEAIVAAEWRGSCRGVRFGRACRSSKEGEASDLLEVFDTGTLGKSDLNCQVQPGRFGTGAKELDERFVRKGTFSELDELGTGHGRPQDYPKGQTAAAAQNIDGSLSLSQYEEENLEVIDWDTYVSALPAAKRSGTVRVRFRYVGKSKPILPDDPWA
jgi:hypothetical protein